MLAAAAALGYTPNAMGRMLVEGATRTIGMVVTEISNPFYPNLIAPLHDELAELGYRMALFTERLEGDAPTRRAASNGWSTAASTGRC